MQTDGNFTLTICPLNLNDMNNNRNLPAWIEVFFFTLILGMALVLTFSYHSQKGHFNWRSEIWADRAGNYIFVPATLYYHWNLSECPPKMDSRTGYGFVYDTVKGKIRTGQSCGLAIPLAPFFVGVHFITKFAGIPQDWGFAPIYHSMVNVAAAFYLVFGLFFLYRFLRKYFSAAVSMITVFFMFAGTNLFYYSVCDGLMTHVYSFFFASAFLLFLKKYFDERGKQLYFLIASVAIAMMVLIRPFSIILLVIPFVLDVRNAGEFKSRARLLFGFSRLPLMLIIIFVGYIPQFIYNHYLSGSYVVFAENGMYSNLLSPKFPGLWFSTINGLFLYTPLMILVIAGMVLMAIRKSANAWTGIILFILLSYIFASQTSWYSGCSFGQRLFIDFLPFFAAPFAFIIGGENQGGSKARTAFIILILVLFSWYNFRMSFAYEGCFFGSSWDWNKFGKTLNSAGLWPSKPGFAYTNDYENASMGNGSATTTLVSRSGSNSLVFDAQHEFNSHFFDYPGNMVKDGKLRKVKVKFYMFKTNSSETGALIVCDISKDGQRLFYDTRPLDVPMARTREWYAMPVNFDIPATIDPWSELKIYVWNKAKTTYYIDDLHIETE